MELQPRFQLGRPLDIDERYKRKRRIRTPFVFSPVWRILPCERHISFFIDGLPGNTYFEKIRSLEDYGVKVQKKSTLFPKYTPNPNLLASIEELKKKSKVKLAENQSFRWIFKRFLTLWRIRHFKKINDIDCITLAPIEKSVQVNYFVNRNTYTFESTSILQDIHKKLLHHSGQIPTPIFPRNPYTNEHFTLAQLISIQKQCKQFGNTSWALEAFYKCKFSIPTFIQVQRKALRIHALKSILYDSSDYEGRSLLLNFMESQHEEHEAHFNEHLYRWCILRIPDDAKIQRWRSFCKEYYQEEILAEDDSERDDCFFRISRKTECLCGPPYDLLAKRNLVLHT